MLSTNQSDCQLLARLLENNTGNVPTTLNSIAEVLAQKTSFFDDDDFEWEKVLLNIFRNQVTREKNRKADEYKRRQIVKKRFQIILLEKELQKHYHDLHVLLRPSSDSIEPSIADNKEKDVEAPNPSDNKEINLETPDIAIKPSNFAVKSTSNVVRTNNRKSNGRKYESKTLHPVKDIYKPKRPRNAFLLWLAKHRHQVRLEHPHLKFAALMKMCGTVWDALQDKREWHAKAAEARCHYNEQLKEFYGLH